MALRVEIDVSGVVRAEKTVTRSTNNMKRQFRMISAQTSLNEKAIRDLAASMDRATNQMAAAVEKMGKRVNGSLKKQRTMFGKMGTTIKSAAIGYATVLASMKAQEFIKNTFDQGIALDSLTRSYEAITGSAHGAAAEMKFVNDIADTYSLDLSVLESSYKDILAASQGTTLAGSNVQNVFTAISKAGAVLGMSADDTKGSLRALSQMISKGNVQAEELRGQLGERLPGAFGMAAEAMGVTTAQLNDMLENGEVLAADLLPKLAEVLENRFGTAAEKAGDRAAAAFIDLGNAVQRLQRAVMKSGLLEFMTKVANQAERLTTSLRIDISGMTNLEEIEDLRRKLKTAQAAGPEEPWTRFGDRTRPGQEGRTSQVEIDAMNKRLQLLLIMEGAKEQIAHWDKVRVDNNVKKAKEEAKVETERAKWLKTRKKQLTEMIEDGNKAEKVIKNMMLAGVAPSQQLIGLVKQRKSAQAEYLELFKKSSAKELTENDKLIQSSKDLLKAKKKLASGYITSKQIEAENKKIVAEQKKMLREVDAATKEAFKEIDAEAKAFAQKMADMPMAQYKKMLDEVTDSQHMLETIGVNTFENLGDALTDFVMTGKLDFKSFASSIIADMARMAIQATIIKPLVKGFGSLFGGGGGGAGGAFAGFAGVFGSATGNAVTGSGATNSVVTGPTFFPGMAKIDAYATGGVVGEAGRPEGILPLTRVGADLGVKADFSGSGEQVTIINIENNVGDKAGVEATTSTNALGQQVIGIVIDAALRDKGNLGKVIKKVANTK